ncbi:energy transducer TonB [Burkholderia cepacia]|uniref:energy transducer TonB n=1 Tax=Burkholderia cepacia TaxID=292 RepID=UPI0007556548|nr:energy transducer TonB [Burkholderia cepacia]KVV64711.1 energy transducer TonB [Burkholderia cepacia]KVV82760.1 energy transducer TonB [Burkholderia cepacia]KVV86439.1 energy transducer TonB [Burkholderia cepacia]KVV90138.1 energy transducer TonB [Burkholderia cepacia]KVV96507.1 energy transducer TonB [Burkholderia cepacia]
MTTASPSRLAAIGRPRRFGNRQTHPVRRFGGIAIAIALHLVLIWALVNGLATRVVQIVQQPIEARIIAPVKPPPPPPPPKPVEKVVSKPRVTASPPPFVPPPEVHVQAPPPATITHQDVPAPSAPVHEAPPAPAPVPVAKPVNREIGVVCPNSDEVRSSIVYPAEAQDNNITGDVTVEFTVDPDGRVTNLRVAQPADPVLNRAALNAVKRFNCIAQGQSVRVRVPFSFNLN